MDSENIYAKNIKNEERELRKISKWVLGSKKVFEHVRDQK